MIKLINNYIKIDTINTSLILLIDNTKVITIYYGKKINDYSDFTGFFNPSLRDGFGSTDDYSYDNTLFSFTGDGNNISSSLIYHVNNELINRLEYTQSLFVDKNLGFTSFPHAYDKEQTIKLIYKDVKYDIYLYIYISTYSDSDVITFSTELFNMSKYMVNVCKLMSLQLDMYGTFANIYTLNGSWTRERTIHKNSINTGIFKNESRSGASSNLNNPFFMFDVNNKFFATNLIYSSNHEECLEVIPNGKIRYMTGMGTYNFIYDLNKGEVLASPEALLVTSNSLDDVTYNMQKFITNHIIRKEYRNIEKPVLINNWEATYFDFDKDKLLRLAKLAKSVGVELFVLDDGWFGKRNNDDCSLGDWVDNVEKTGRLPLLSKKMKEMGLKFGLWVEPEMISKISDLNALHPEFMMKIPGVNPVERRNQQMLDLVNPLVQDFLIDILSNVFKTVNPDYVKWDCNRNMIDVYSPTLLNNGRYYLDYMKGLYHVLHTLCTGFPNILFESCSAGGNRFDLGMMYFFPQAWCSDNTDATWRLYSQEGTLVAYPQASIGSHVSICPNHQTEASVSLESRFNVALIGAFGYEMDFEKASKEDLDVITNQIKFYKKYRSLIANGTYYNLNLITFNKTGGWIVVSSNKDEAIALIVDKSFEINTLHKMFTFKGLRSDFLYEVSIRNQANLKTPFKPFKMYGDALMNSGIDFGNLYYQENDRAKNGYSFSSRIVLFKKVDE